MRKIFNIETSSEAEWDAVLKIIRISLDDKYFTDFEISISYDVYNSNAFKEWLDEVMHDCCVNPSYRFWRFDEHVMTCDKSYRRIIFRKAYVDDKSERACNDLDDENGNISKHCKNLENELKKAHYEQVFAWEREKKYTRRIEELEKTVAILKSETETKDNDLKSLEKFRQTTLNRAHKAEDRAAAYEAISDERGKKCIDLAKENAELRRRYECLAKYAWRRVSNLEPSTTDDLEDHELYLFVVDGYSTPVKGKYHIDGPSYITIIVDDGDGRGPQHKAIFFMDGCIRYWMPLPEMPDTAIK